MYAKLPKKSLGTCARPFQSFSWPHAIVIAAADVNAEITGMDTKRTKNPRRRSPIRRRIIPVYKESATAVSAQCGTLYVAVIRDNIDVGPIVTSFEVPDIVYMKTPMKEENSPYSLLSLAIDA